MNDCVTILFTLLHYSLQLGENNTFDDVCLFSTPSSNLTTPTSDPPIRLDIIITAIAVVVIGILVFFVIVVALLFYRAGKKKHSGMMEQQTEGEPYTWQW